MEILQEIRVQHFDLAGPSLEAKDEKVVRVSIYFDYTNDNHHIQIPVRAERMVVCKALIDLAELIANYNQPCNRP